MMALKLIFYFLAFFQAGHANESNTYLCLSYPIYKLTDDKVRDLLYVTSLARSPAGQFPANIDHVQCGLPGEDWRICAKCTDEIDMKAYKKVVPFLANSSHREWHFDWHVIRNQIVGDGMNTMDPSDKEIKKWQEENSVPQDVKSFQRDHSFRGTLAGEDFFFMHRQMIKMVQTEMTAKDGACIKGWEQVPTSALDKKWPSPMAAANKTDKAIVEGQQKVLDQIHENLKKFKDEEYLRSVSLSEFGKAVEGETHALLHSVYNNAKSTCKDPNKDNRLECNDMTHDRSSHVNPLFWKVHGYIDNMIGDWLKANGKKTIAEDCSGKADCYTWKGTWTGSIPK